MTQKPRIVIDGRESGTSTGRYVDKLLEHLNKLAPELDILVLSKASRIDYLISLAPNFTIIESNYPEFSFGEQLGLLKQIRSLKPDLVHFTMTQQPIFYRGRVITTIHDLTTARFRNPAKNWLIYSVKQQIYKQVIKRVASKSVKLITPSEFVKHDVAQYANIPLNKIIVIYEAADKINQEPEPVKNLVGQKFLLYVGRALPHKNLERLVAAYGQIAQTQPDLKLVLAGKFDANYQLLKKYVYKTGVKGIIFTDFVPDANLRWLYENATAYVLSTLSEGFGLPALEAMLYDLPVASSNASCLPEIYQGAALYFDPLDINDMVLKINQILENPQLAQQLAQKGRKLSKQYSWKHLAEQTLALYNDSLSS